MRSITSSERGTLVAECVEVKCYKELYATDVSIPRSYFHDFKVKLYYRDRERSWLDVTRRVSVIYTTSQVTALLQYATIYQHWPLLEFGNSLSNP